MGKPADVILERSLMIWFAFWLSNPHIGHRYCHSFLNEEGRLKTNSSILRYFTFKPGREGVKGKISLATQITVRTYTQLWRAAYQGFSHVNQYNFKVPRTFILSKI